jgi:hypothetical protein|tara:strand:+ start:167 stop:469 length:303 start_codon:yes stop_codon:yes gene_type:complete
MLVKLTEVCGGNPTFIALRDQFTLKEIFVNPEHVVMVREETRMRQLNEQGLLPEGLDTNHRFSKLTINRGHTGTEIVVVGAPEMVETELNLSRNKQLLKG